MTIRRKAPSDISIFRFTLRNIYTLPGLHAFTLQVD